MSNVIDSKGCWKDDITCSQVPHQWPYCVVINYQSFGWHYLLVRWGWNCDVRLSVLSDRDLLQNERCSLNLVGCCNYILVWLHLVSFSGDGWHVYFVLYLKYLVWSYPVSSDSHLLLNMSIMSKSFEDLRWVSTSQSMIMQEGKKLWPSKP